MLSSAAELDNVHIKCVHLLNIFTSLNRILIDVLALLNRSYSITPLQHLRVADFTAHIAV